MKRRNLERVERRRNLLELNLISETKPRLVIRRRGCLASLVPAVLALALTLLAVYTSGLR